MRDPYVRFGDRGENKTIYFPSTLFENVISTFRRVVFFAGRDNFFK